MLFKRVLEINYNKVLPFFIPKTSFIYDIGLKYKSKKILKKYNPMKRRKNRNRKALWRSCLCSNKTLKEKSNSYLRHFQTCTAVKRLHRATCPAVREFHALWRSIGEIFFSLNPPCFLKTLSFPYFFFGKKGKVLFCFGTPIIAQEFVNATPHHRNDSEVSIGPLNRLLWMIQMNRFASRLYRAFFKNRCFRFLTTPYLTYCKRVFATFKIVSF